MHSQPGVPPVRALSQASLLGLPRQHLDPSLDTSWPQTSTRRTYEPLRRLYLTRQDSCRVGRMRCPTRRHSPGVAGLAASCGCQSHAPAPRATSLNSSKMDAFSVTTRFSIFGMMLWVLVTQTIIKVCPVVEGSPPSTIVIKWFRVKTPGSASARSDFRPSQGSASAMSALRLRKEKTQGSPPSTITPKTFREKTPGLASAMSYSRPQFYWVSTRNHSDPPLWWNPDPHAHPRYQKQYHSTVTHSHLQYPQQATETQTSLSSKDQPWAGFLFWDLTIAEDTIKLSHIPVHTITALHNLSQMPTVTHKTITGNSQHSVEHAQINCGQALYCSINGTTLSSNANGLGPTIAPPCSTSQCQQTIYSLNISNCSLLYTYNHPPASGLHTPSTPNLNKQNSQRLGYLSALQQTNPIEYIHLAL